MDRSLVIITHNLKIGMVHDDLALVFLWFAKKYHLMPGRQHIFHPRHIEPSAGNLVSRKRPIAGLNDHRFVKLLPATKALHLRVDHRAPQTTAPSTRLGGKVIKPTPVFVSLRQAIEQVHHGFHTGRLVGQYILGGDEIHRGQGITGTKPAHDNALALFEMRPHILNDNLQIRPAPEHIAVNGKSDVPRLFQTRQLALAGTKKHRIMPTAVLLH